MRKLTSFIAALALMPSLALASPVAQVVRVTDASGNPVTGATFAIGGTTLTAGTAATVTGLNIDTGAALTSPSVKYYDFGDGSGQYSFIYDPASAQGHFNITASKSGVTLSNPVFGVNFYSDPSVILSTNANTVTLGTGQTNLQNGQATILSQTSSATRQADMTTGLTTQGYTTARAAKLDNADVATSTRSTFAGGAVASVTAPVVASSVTAPVSLPTTAPAGYGGGATLSQIQALLPANFGLFSVDSTGGVKVVTLPAAPTGYGFEGLQTADINAVRDAIVNAPLFPGESGFSLLNGWQDTWGTEAGPATNTYPDSTHQATVYKTPGGAGQHSTGLTTNTAGKPIARNTTHP